MVGLVPSNWVSLANSSGEALAAHAHTRSAPTTKGRSDPAGRSAQTHSFPGNSFQVMSHPCRALQTGSKARDPALCPSSGPTSEQG